MNPFQALLLEGVFPKEGPLQVEGQQSIAEALQPYEGQDVILTAHHVPNFPIVSHHWGGGSCGWQPHACPAGHHLPERHQTLYAVHLEGVLVREGGDWVVEQFDGSRVPAQLTTMLPGHQARVLCVTKFSADEMRETLAQSGHLDAVESLGTQLSDIQSVLSKLQGKTDD